LRESSPKPFFKKILFTQPLKHNLKTFLNILKHTKMDTQRLRDIVSFLYNPKQTQKRFAIFYSPRIHKFSIIDTIVAVRQCSPNAARIQWRKIQKKFGPFPFTKLKYTGAPKSPFVTIGVVFTILSYLKGYEGLFFTSEMHAYLLSTSKREQENEVSSTLTDSVGDIREDAHDFRVNSIVPLTQFVNGRDQEKSTKDDPNVIGELHEINYNAMLCYDVY
jgi:hypothetical protein